MNKHLLLPQLALLVLLTACNNANNPVAPAAPFHKGEKLALTSEPLPGYQEPLAAPRRIHAYNEYYLEDNITKVTAIQWDAADQIDVFVINGVVHDEKKQFAKSVFSLVSGANTGKGTFSGEMPADGDYYVLSYPVADGNTVVQDMTMGNEHMCTFTQMAIPAKQYYREPSAPDKDGISWATFDSGLLPIVGYGEKDQDFEIAICGGAFCVKAYSSKPGGQKLGKIELQAHHPVDPVSSDGMSICGAYMVDYDWEEDNYKMYTIGSGLTTMTLYMGHNGEQITLPSSSAEALSFLFVLPAPLRFDDGYDVYFYEDPSDDEYNEPFAKLEKMYEVSTPVEKKVSISPSNISFINYNSPVDLQSYLESDNHD